MRCLRYILALGIAALIGTAATVKAEEAPKVKIPEVKKEMAGVTNAVKKDAEKQMKESKEKADELKKQKMEKADELKKHQMEKADELKKEAGKGSEKGQAMREEHSKKWWKFWGKEPAAE